MTTPKTALIADDDPELIEIISEIAQESFNVATAHSGAEALKKIEELIPSVAILDVIMPEMDGFEVCKRVRALTHLDSVRIVFITGQTQLDKRLRGYSMGGNDYLTKPFDREELLAKMKIYASDIEREMQVVRLNQELLGQLNKQSEDLMNRERLAHIGLHVAEVVHNLKGPLTVMPHYLEQIAVATNENNITPKMSKAIRKLDGMVNGIMQGVRGSSHDCKTEVDINILLLDELEWLKLNAFLKYKVEIITDFIELPSIKANPYELAQVFGNILKNAVEAMLQVTNPKIILTTNCRSKLIEVAITDNGPGIAERNLPLIFQPHFTTKGNQHGAFVNGTGLGLAYCKKVVESYGGSINVHSKCWKGTTFIVSLPVT